MFRVRGCLTRRLTAVVASQALRAYSAPGAAGAAAAAAAPAEVSVDQIWGLWNEGNLFSLSAVQLTQFLSGQRIDVDPRWKKAALVRQVEELLQAKDNEAKASQKGGGGAAAASSGDRGTYGNWEKPTMAKETLLDLGQAGFYEGGTHVAPRAFQVLVHGAAADLVVARVNTTSFPGFPANSECYTLTGADPAQSTRARYSKALQWCVMNMRNLGMDGEACIEFGKFLVKKDVMKKNRKVVSSWTLQQRLQTQNPHLWVNALSASATPGIEKLLSANGYKSLPTVRSYDVKVRRANDGVDVQLNASGATVAVTKPWDHLQTSHYVREGGPDIRFLLRTRPPLKKAEVDTFTKANIVNVKKDPVEATLAPELGMVVYTSENSTRKWEKKLDVGVALCVSECRREPLIMVNKEEEDERLEYRITASIPQIIERADLGTLANELYDLALAIADVSSASFLQEFKTNSSAPTLEQE